MAGLRLGPEGWHNSLVTITDWRKSSHSSSYNGCLEAGNWRTSTRSIGNGACVQIAAPLPDFGVGMLVRDSKLGELSPVLAFSITAWRSFTAQLKTDQRS